MLHAGLGRPQATTEEQRKATEAVKKKREEADSKMKDMEAAKLKSMDALKQEHAYLESQFSRNEKLRHVSRVESCRAASRAQTTVVW